MMTELSLTAFVTTPENLEDDLKPTHIEALLEALTKAERPRSFRVLFWLLLQTLQGRPEFHAALVEDWMPSESDLAQLLEDAGRDGTRTVLSLEGVGGHMARLWQLCDEIGVAGIKTSGPWQAASLAPMAALYTERQLDELLTAVSRSRQWQDPAEILSPSGDMEFDLEALLALAQSRMVNTTGSEALNIVVLRLLNAADRVN